MTQQRIQQICLYVEQMVGVLGFLFLTLSLLTFNPADPPNQEIWPNNAIYHNFFGMLGAMFARWMFHIFGLGVWYIVVSMGGWVLLSLFQASSARPYRNFVVWCFSLALFCGFCSTVFPTGLPHTPIGSGGFVGAIARELFAPLGIASGILLGFLTLAGTAFWVSRTCIPPDASCTPGRFAKLWNSIWEVRPRFLPKKKLPIPQTDWPPFSEKAPNPAVLLASGPASTALTTPAPTSLSGASSVVVEIPHGKVSTEKEGISIHHPVTFQSDATTIIEENVEETEYVYPSIELLEMPLKVDYTEFEAQAAERAQFLEQIIASFGFQVHVREIQLGPVITQYRVEMEEGLRVAKISNLVDDLAVKLGVPNVRIVYPILGKQNLVGIEIPNVQKQWVHLREVMEELSGSYSKYRIPIFLGKDVAGQALMTDLAKLPHLLIAGRTGTGKSVCLNSIITSILMTRSPKEVRMLMIDPKMVELSQYRTIPHLMHPVLTDMQKAATLLSWAVDKMEERYRWLARVGVRNIDAYNELSMEAKLSRMKNADVVPEDVPEKMPYIVIIVDEMADLILVSPREIESHIIRLAQKSRGAGIHLILATQKPIVSVITSLIKANLPARIAFQVSSKGDSRVVLDAGGADRLLGNGDMLFLLPGTSTLIRAQGTYLSDSEIFNVVNAISTETMDFAPEIEDVLSCTKNNTIEEMAARDALYLSAVDIIIREGRGSITLLQRSLGIGYGRASRLIDFMESDGIVGKFAGYTKPREVLVTQEQWEARLGRTQDENDENTKNENSIDEVETISPEITTGTPEQKADPSEVPWDSLPPNSDLPQSPFLGETPTSL